jgi:peroxiredoxin
MLFVLLAPSAAAVGTTLPPTADRPLIGPDADTPQVVAFNITPKTLKNNRINVVQLSFKFADAGANLKGGLLNINFVYKSPSGEPLTVLLPPRAGLSGLSAGPRAVAVLADRGRPTFVTYHMTETVFGNKTGEFKLQFGLLAEDFATVDVGIWLGDAAGHNGAESPWITLVRSTASSGPEQGRQVGQLAYDFTLLDKAGNRKTLSNYRGKVVLVDFSTMWCGPCKIEASELQQLYLKYRSQGFIVLAVLCENYASDPVRPSDCKAWAETYHLTVPVLADLFWGVFDPYYAFPSTRRIPNNVLIDKTGKIRWKKLGYTAPIKAQLEAKIQQLLAE